MAQQLTQVQEQRQQQQQRLSQQQLLVVRLVEMPLAEFEQSVLTELDDNPALEVMTDGDTTDSTVDDEAYDTTDAALDDDSRERRDALDDALQQMTADDDMPDPVHGSYAPDTADYEERVYGTPRSFYDSLSEQVAETRLTDRQAGIMDYLIGSLDSDGLLRKTADDIADELAIYHGQDVTVDDVARCIDILKSFDPPGIGAATLRECLLIQIRRRPDSQLREMMTTVVRRCYGLFMAKNYSKIAAQTGIAPDTLQRVVEEIQRLNPKPGAALCETEGSNVQQITPDFIVDTADDGTVSFYINQGQVPHLHVSPAFTQLIQGYKANSAGMNRNDKEALLYAKQRVDRARGYIEAIRRRHETMSATMKAIIDIQGDFFRSGDEADLKPMVLKDIAQKVNLDISTVSRVCQVKYAQTRWGIFRLRHFFSESIHGNDGEEMSNRRVKAALREVIEHEDKQHPLNDEALSREMGRLGYNVARRTVTKYRKMMGIPVARLRK